NKERKAIQTRNFVVELVAEDAIIKPHLYSKRAAESNARSISATQTLSLRRKSGVLIKTE
ncbi:MAG TPA: hypothetical protein VEM96_09295, partial [Pyrinomonadaceae bacterium]|nr:hypothetical protein [Pyrinomonadaceae bacterium]